MKITILDKADMSDILNINFSVVIQVDAKTRDYSRLVRHGEAMPHLCDILRPMIDDFIAPMCDWPLCQEVALCSSENAGGALVCKKHFLKIHGGNALQLDELEDIEKMAEKATSRDANK